MTTYEEYRQLRRDIGFDEDIAMAEKVWNGCTPEAQEDMLAQLRGLAEAGRKWREERAHYGDAW